MWRRIGQVVGCCDYGDEPSVEMNFREFLGGEQLASQIGLFSPEL
jgi:hypothetical protein